MNSRSTRLPGIPAASARTPSLAVSAAAPADEIDGPHRRLDVRRCIEVRGSSCERS
jgi:hypothetical protein